MAENTPLFLTEEPGQDLVLDLHEPDNGTAAASDLTLSASGNAPGEYSTTVTTALTGLHRASVKSAGTVIAVFEVILYDITDRLTCVELGTAYAREAAAYPGRRIFIDTVNGVAGTVPCENGTVNQPVDTWADALTLAETLGYSDFYVVSGSTLSLSSSGSNYNFDGENYAFYPNGQSINGTTVRNAIYYCSVSSSTNTATRLINCEISKLTMGSSAGINLIDCIFTTATEHDLQGICKLYRCRADTLLANPVLFDLQGSGSPYPTIALIDWVGDLRLKRLYYQGRVHVYGSGIITLDSDCTGGVLKRHGNLPLVDNVSGGFENLANGYLYYEPQPTNMIEINDSATAAQTVQEVHEDRDRLVVDDATFTPETGAFETDGTDTADDTFKGRAGTWFSSSGSPANKGTFFVSSSEGTVTNSNGKVKIFIDPLRPLATPPAAGDVFILLGARTQ